MKQKEFKQKMPECAAFIESLCEAFGKEAIHGQIRKGLNGEPTFWASENEHEIGTPVDCGATVQVTWDEYGVAVATEIKRGPDGKRIGKENG